DRRDGHGADRATRPVPRRARRLARGVHREPAALLGRDAAARRVRGEDPDLPGDRGRRAGRHGAAGAHPRHPALGVPRAGPARGVPQGARPALHHHRPHPRDERRRSPPAARAAPRRAARHHLVRLGPGRARVRLGDRGEHLRPARHRAGARHRGEQPRYPHRSRDRARGGGGLRRRQPPRRSRLHPRRPQAAPLMSVLTRTTTGTRSTTGLPVRPGTVAAGGFVALVLVAAMAPELLTGDTPTRIDLPNALAAPSWQHPFGTDEAGRDLLTRVIHGTRLSLGIGLAATGVSMVLAIVLGATAALAGGVVDAVINRILEVTFAFPSLL